VSQQIFKDFVRLTNGISLGYFWNILEYAIIKENTKEVGVGPNIMTTPMTKT
jgi:hypothetical protein